MAYKTKSLLEKIGFDYEGISTDLKESIELIKTLSDDFATDDKEALELDSLIEKELTNFVDSKTQPITQEEEEENKLTSISQIPELVRKFMPLHQQEVLVEMETEEHWNIFKDIENHIKQLPKLYGTEREFEKAKKENKSLEFNDFAKVYLHYFYGGSDWFILEHGKDGKQDLLFGYAILNGDVEMSELGYIDLSELTKNGKVELDFFWTIVPLSEALENSHPDFFVKKEEIKDKETEPIKIISEEILTPTQSEEDLIEIQPATELTDTQLEQIPEPSIKPSQQAEINQRIRTLVAQKGIDPLKYSETELLLLEKYEGSGGLAKKGEIGARLLDQFFTPMEVVDKMWGLALKHGFKFDHADILEPSAGTGRFLRHIPIHEINSCDTFEIDETSHKILKIFFYEREFNHRFESFETLFFEGNRHLDLIGVRKFYDLVIGNPPYREYHSHYAPLGEREATGAKTFDQYFLMRGIDVLKSGGLLVYLIPSSFMFNKVLYNDFKNNLMKKADFVDAYRLPSGCFGNTDVTTDILILRKK